MIPLRDDNPSSITPVVRTIFVVLCVLVFLWQFSLGPIDGERIVYSLGAIPAVLLGLKDLPPDLALVPPSMTTITSMFMHGGWMHLIGNMLYLWIFGDNVEDSMGHVRFAVFYMLCGLAAVLAQALPDPNSDHPDGGRERRDLGRARRVSSALSARTRARCDPPRLRPADDADSRRRRADSVVWSAVAQQPDDACRVGGVAFRAHIGGFVAGMALIPLFKQRRFRLRTPWGAA